jgi:hypothetical protein
MFRSFFYEWRNRTDSKFAIGKTVRSLSVLLSYIIQTGKIPSLKSTESGHLMGTEVVHEFGMCSIRISLMSRKTELKAARSITSKNISNIYNCIQYANVQHTLFMPANLCTWNFECSRAWVCSETSSFVCYMHGWWKCPENRTRKEADLKKVSNKGTVSLHHPARNSDYKR